MRFFFFFLSFFFFYGCMNTPEIPSAKEDKSTQKILGNQTEAIEAKEEYRRLQIERSKNQ